VAIPITIAQIPTCSPLQCTHAVAHLFINGPADGVEVSHIDSRIRLRCMGVESRWSLKSFGNVTWCETEYTRVSLFRHDSTHCSVSAPNAERWAVDVVVSSSTSGSDHILISISGFEESGSGPQHAVRNPSPVPLVMRTALRVLLRSS